MMQHKVKNEDMIKLIMDALDHNQKAIFKVVGHSMRPLFKHEKTSVTLVKHKALNKGDIVLFRYKGQYMLHRIIGKTERHLLCQGDALRSVEIIMDDQVIGVVESFSKGHKKISLENKWYLFQLKLWFLVKPMVVRKRNK